MADRYWSPSPNHANQWEFSIAEPQTLGFSSDARKGSEEDFRPAQMADLFSPPPLMAAAGASASSDGPCRYAARRTPRAARPERADGTPQAGRSLRIRWPGPAA